MATVKVVDLVSRAQTILQDTSNVRWPVLELQDWLNDGYREIVLARPDINSATGTFDCASGTRQVLTKPVGGFPSALTLLDVVRNTATLSNKRAVRPVDRRILDDQRRGWHAEDESINIEYFMHDPMVPKEFLVYPPADSTAKLEVVYSSVPTAHTLTEAQLINTATTETIKIDDSYANALLDYMLYRAYSKDIDYAANKGRATGHYQAMAQALGVKTKVDVAAAGG